jgi:hypothetical protein
VANKPKSTSKSSDRDRRAKVEAMRREQQSRERRKSLLFIVIAVVVGLGLVAAAAVPAYLESRDDPTNQALDTFGPPATDADCDEVTTDATTGGNDHREDGEKLDYEQVPPSSGPHWNTPALSSRKFYTADDRPPTEQLVHNLEHGYTILWYDDTIEGAQLDTIRDLAESAAAQDQAGPTGKFIAVAWDDSYGSFPEGKHVALSHWGATEGHRQLCGRASGEAVQEFMEQFPYSDSPEPNAA